MQAASRTGSIPSGSSWISRRFFFVLLFLGALNAAGIWWIRESLRPRSPSLRVLSTEVCSDDKAPQSVRVVFTRDVVPQEPSERPDANDWIRLSPEVAGSARWETPRELLFEPRTPLPFSREITLILTPPARPSGPLFEGPLRFTLRTPALKLENAFQLSFAAEPTPRATASRENDATLRLVFNGPIVPQHLPSHLLLLAPGGEPLPYTLLSDKTSKEVDLRLQSPGTRILVVLGPALAGKQDFFGLNTQRSVEVELTRVLRLTEARGSRVTLGSPTLEVYFNNAVATEEGVPLERYFALEPALRFTVTPQYSRVQLDGEFEPGARYRLTVKKGLRGAAGSVLAEDATREVYFPDREPTLSFAGQGTVLSSQGNTSLLLKTVNVRTVSVQASRIHSNDLVHAFERDARRSHFVRALPPRIYHVPDGVNQVRELVVDLHDLVGPDPRGVWQVEASSGPGETDHTSSADQVISVSDIGLSVKESSRHELVAWSVSLCTGEPIAGVTVGLRSLSNQLIAESVTRADGLAFFEGLPGDDGPPHLVVATKESDLAYLELSKRRLSRADFDVGGRPYLTSGCEAFLFTDRGVYRPGESVRLRCLVRGAGSAVPGTFPVEVDTLRPDGKRYRIEKAQLDHEGAFDAVIPITSSAHTGLYQVEVRLAGGSDGPGASLGSETFRVEEYMPSRLRVEISAQERSGTTPDEDPGRHRPGEVLELHVRGTHLFGLPAAGCAVDVSWSLAPVQFAPREWRGFHFGELKEPKLDPRVEAQSLVLDASGETMVKVRVPQVEAASPLALRFTARVTDLGGRPVAGGVSVPIDPAPHYLGLRALAGTGGEGIERGKAARFECLALKPDATPAGIDAADLIVQAYEWASVLKRDSNGEYRYESREEIKEVARQRVHFSGGRGAFEYIFTEWGAYRLRLKDPASLAATELYVFAGGPGAGFTPSSLEKPERLEIAFARGTYRPGELAGVSVRAPFGGTLLLTLETERVQWAHVVKMENCFATAEVPVPSDASAACYVGACVVRGVDLNDRWLPHRAFGLERVPLDLSARRLTVTLDAPREALPGGVCTVRASITREDGEPVQGAEVLLALVDEGILSLTGEEMPDPFDFFYGRRAHAVETSDTFTALLEEAPLARDLARPGGDEGRGGGEARRLNPVPVKRLTPAVVWLGPVATGVDGSAVAHLRLPELMGELRFTVVASAGSSFGSSRRSLILRRPFFFETSFPPFLAPGDHFSVPVSVFNRTAIGGAAALSWSLENLHEGPEPPSSDLVFAVLRDSKIDVPAGGAARAAFHLRAGGEIGKASARLEAALEGLSHVETINLPVRPPVPRTGESRSGEVTAAAPVELMPSRTYLKGTFRHRLVLSEFPELDLAGSLKYLLESPHDCIEQTTSSAFALLYLHDLAEKTCLLGYGAATDGANRIGAAQSFVEGGIAHILDMQSQGGWMTMYPGSQHPAPWCTVYATHFLIEARNAGYAVPEEELDAALRYVEEGIVKAPPSTASPAILQTAYGAYVLALAQKPEPKAMSRLRDLATGAAPLEVDPSGKPVPFVFPPSARAFLAAAYLLVGDRATALSLEDGPLAPASTDVESGGTFRSPAREDAILLSALVEIDPADSRIPELLDRLGRQRADGRWGTTQENAFALLAIGKYSRYRQRASQDYRAVVEVAGEPPIQLNPGESRELNGADFEGSIKVSVTGSGSIFYWWWEEGIPADGSAPEVDSGLVARRTLLDRDRKPLDPAALRVGEDVIIRWTIEAIEPVDNVVVTDLLPAGLEVENRALGGSSMGIPNLDLLPAESVSVRDDRVIAFFNLTQRRKGEFYYVTRAVTQGEFQLPPLSAEAMYRPGIRSMSGSGKVVIR